jgi:hypothetical protein|tara:strand:- start:427 stop:603 length:177 start_codon:yes stop_codon:yes gene_type:complete
LSKSIKEVRKQFDGVNTDMLLKNQIDEENRINQVTEINFLESEFEGLKHKYDRKELIL